MRLRSLALILLAGIAVTGCANKHPNRTASARVSFAPSNETPAPESLKAQNTRSLQDDKPVEVALLRPADPSFGGNYVPRPGGLAGRQLFVSSASQIALRDKEVVLTFDDGPIPGRTEKVLSVLDQFKVKATFLMVGQMARNYSSLAQDVVARGHTIGSHTFDHANLQNKGHSQALQDIVSGDAAVRKATGTSTGFFRFPYLADTSSLRQDLADAGVVILDVDIDSKDYFKSTPEAIAARTMALVRARGKGIILMHDIHNRTSAMLPAFLSMLKSEGYSVVALRYGNKPKTRRVALATGL